VQLVGNWSRPSHGDLSSRRVEDPAQWRHDDEPRVDRATQPGLIARSSCGEDSDGASDRAQCGNDLPGEAASAVPGIVEDDQTAARPTPVESPSRIQRS
jgi:hypothetical protein